MVNRYTPNIKCRKAVGTEGPVLTFSKSLEMAYITISKRRKCFLYSWLNMFTFLICMYKTARQLDNEKHRKLEKQELCEQTLAEYKAQCVEHGHSIPGGSD